MAEGSRSSISRQVTAWIELLGYFSIFLKYLERPTSILAAAARERERKQLATSLDSTRTRGSCNRRRVRRRERGKSREKSWHAKWYQLLRLCSLLLACLSSVCLIWLLVWLLAWLSSCSSRHGGSRESSAAAASLAPFSPHTPAHRASHTRTFRYLKPCDRSNYPGQGQDCASHAGGTLIPGS